MKAIKKLGDIKESLGVDSISRKDGVITIREGFFYTHGKTVEGLIKKVKALFPEAVIVSSGEKWSPFHGGQSIASGSHWWVSFTN